MKRLAGISHSLSSCYVAPDWRRAAAGVQPGANPPAAAGAPAAIARDFVRENYTKFEYRIPMRDGVKLFTSVYVPKDVFTDGKTYPIMMQRTGYNVRPTASISIRATLGPSESFRPREIHLRLSGRPRPLS